MSTPSTEIGERLFDRVAAYPPHSTGGVFALYGTPLDDDDFAAAGYPSMTRDAQGIAHVFRGTAAMPVRGTCALEVGRNTLVRVRFAFDSAHTVASFGCD